MLVDVDLVLKEHKPWADSTLRNMKKDKLIEYVRMLEYNYNVAINFNRQQAENFEKLFEEEIEKKSWDYNTIYDWYINSIDETIPPCWTEEHIYEVTEDFFMIPKRV